MRHFRKASLLAVTLTSLLLLFLDTRDAGAVEPAEEDVASAAEQVSTERAEPVARTPNRKDAGRAPDVDSVAKATGEEAERTFAGVREGVQRNLPKLALVAALIAFAWLSIRVLRAVTRRTLGDWPRATALTAVSAVAIWLVTVALSVTILAGDVRAFVGSVGLLGLALSWALQTPIESFTGWLLNAFKGHYRVGDRIEVGDIVGDVHRIDVLTTTLWEIGSPFRSSYVHAEQPTGRLITFPNNQVLTGSVMNYTRDFAYVWDELTTPIANESELRYAVEVLERVSAELLGAAMEAPAREYDRLLRRANLEGSSATAPEVFVSPAASWTNVTIRYLVAARKRRKWKSDLVLRIADELARPEHRGRIIPAVPRSQLQLVDRDGLPRDVAWTRADDDGAS